MRDYIQAANAHIQANLDGKFDIPSGGIKSKQELIDALKEGKTVKDLHDEISVRFVSMTSILTSSMFSHTTEAYKRDYRKGMRTVFKNLGIS